MFLSVVSPVYASKRLYNRALGKKLDLNNPQTLNEKCMWLKLNTYYRHPLITECCDKYLVRNYVKRMGCGEILNDLIGVWSNPDEIDFNSLPDKFVLKCNHGCGYNIICTDKNTLNIKKTKKQLKKWLREDFWKLYAETQYKFIKKRIICEKYIETKDSPLPIDYKFFCENGKFKTLQIITDRETDITLYYFEEALNYRPDYYSLDEVDIVNMGHPKLPPNIKDMIKIVKYYSSSSKSVSEILLCKILTYNTSSRLKK